MKQLTTTEHVLEMRESPNTIWHPPIAGMYKPAVRLAWQGRLTEAIETACDIRIREYGEMHGISFRCVTKTETITVLGGEGD